MAAFEPQPLPNIYDTPAPSPGQQEGSITGDLALSWEIGLEQMRGVPAWIQGAGAALLEKAGFEDAAVGQRIAARNLVYEMSENIASLESLYTGPHSWAEAREKGSPGAYALWGINEAVKQVPNLSTMILGSLATGGVGALLGRFALGRAIGLVPGAAFKRSSLAGVALSSALLNTGEIYSSALLETGENNPGVTGFAGLVAGSLDLWPGSKVVRAMGKGPDLGSYIGNKFLRDKKWRSRFYRSLELGATELMIEDIQTVIEAATVNYLNDNDLAKEYVDYAYGLVPITAEQVGERMEARAAGGLLGGLIGLAGRTSARRLPQRLKPEITVEDIRDIDDQIATISEDEAMAYASSFRPATSAELPGTRPFVRPGEYPDPFAVSRFETLRGKVSRTEETKYADPLSQKASDAIGIPAVKAKKQSKKEIAALQKAEKLAQDEARILTGLGLPAPEGAPTTAAPTVEAVDVEEQAKKVVNMVTNPVPDRESLEVQQDVEQTLLMAMQLLHQDKALKEGQEALDIQREVAVDYYLRALERTRPELKGLTRKQYEKLFSAPEYEAGTGLLSTDGRKTAVAVNEILTQADLTKEDLGLEGRVSGFNLEKALINWIGEERLADVSHRLGEEQQAAETAAFEENKLRKLRSLLGLIQSGRLNHDVQFMQVAADLINKWGGPEAASVVAQLDSRIKESENRRQETVAEKRRVSQEVRKQKLGFRTALKDLTPAEIAEAERTRKETVALEEPLKMEPGARRIRKAKRVRYGERIVDGKVERYPIGEVTIPRRRGLAKAIPGAVTEGAAPIVSKRKTLEKEPVVVTTQALIDKIDKQLAAAKEPVTENELETFTQSAAFSTIVLNDFKMSDIGDNIVAPAQFPWDKRGQVQKLLDMYLPDGPNIYDLDYFETLMQNVMTAEGKIIEVHPSMSSVQWIEIEVEGAGAIPALGKKRPTRKIKVPVSVPYDPWGGRIDMQEKSETYGELQDVVLSIAGLKAEIKERTGKDPLKVAPNGSYVVRESPPKKKIFGYERDKNGDPVLDDEGNLVGVIRDKKKGEGGKLVERLIQYDKNDQIIAEQFVDDQRNYEIIASLEALKREYGVIKNIPIPELAKIAKKYGIRSEYIGAVRRKPKTKEVVVDPDVISQVDFATLEDQNYSGDEMADTMWFSLPSGRSEDEFIALGRLSKLYQELRVTHGEERAWGESLLLTIQEVQSDAEVLFNQIVAENPYMEEKELAKVLKKAGAIFTKDEEAALTNFIEENKSYLTDPANLAHELKLPKGSKLATPNKVYDSLKGSQSQGKRTISRGYDEDEDSFYSRASAPERTPSVLTNGTQVSLSAKVWGRAMREKGSPVRDISESIMRLRKLLGDKAPKQPSAEDVILKDANELFERHGERPIELLYENVFRGEQDLWSYWSLTDQELFDKANEMGWFSHKYFGKLFPGKKTIDAEVMRSIRATLGYSLKKKGVARPTTIQLTQDSQRKLDNMQALFKKRVNAKPIKTIGGWIPAGEKEIDGKKVKLRTIIQVTTEADEAILLDGLEILQKELELAIGNFIETEYTIVGRSKEMYVLEPVRGGKKVTVPEEYLMVRKYSEKGIKRLQENEIYKINQKIKLLKERGTPVGRARADKALTFPEGGLGNRRIAAYRNAIRKIDQQIIGEKEEATAAFEKGQMPLEVLNRRINKINDSRDYRRYEELSKRNFAGRPLLILPKEYQDQITTETIGKTTKTNRKVIVDKFLKDVKKRYETESRRTRGIRISRERNESRDVLKLMSLQTPTGKWLPINQTAEQIKVVAKELKTLGPLDAKFKDSKRFDRSVRTVINNADNESEELVYRALKKRFNDLMLSVESRSIKRPETYEGERLPQAWREGRYWEFVKSQQLDFESAVEAVIRRALRTETNIVVPYQAVENVIGSGGKWIKTTPVQRWKNAYGVIIDKIFFQYIPNGKTVEEAEIWQMYEVIDPFRPDEFRNFRTLEEAKAVFQKAKYYKEMGQWKGRGAPSPRQLGRLVRFPTPALKNRKPTKGRPTGQVTNEVGATTDQIAEEASTLTAKVDIFKRGATYVKQWKKGGEIGERRKPEPVAAGKKAVKVHLKEKGKPAGFRVGQLFADEDKAKTLAKNRTNEDVSDVAIVDKETGYAVYPSEKQTEETKKADTETPVTLQGLLKTRLLHSIVLEGEYTENGLLHILSKKTDDKGSTRAAVVDRLNEAFGRQIFSFVHVIQSEADLPLNLRTNPEKYTSGVRAVTFNHEIWMVADNIPENRIVPVALHEIGSHGMQAVMGKRFYQKVLGQVAVLVNSDPEIGEMYKVIKSQMSKEDAENQALILEEVMAYIVESEAMTNSPFWRVIIDAVLYGLARLKLWLNPKWIGAEEIYIFAKAAARKYSSLSKDKNAVFAANFLDVPLYSGEMGGDRASSTDTASRKVARMGEVIDPHITQGFEGEWWLFDLPPPVKWWEHFLYIREVRAGKPAIEGIPIRKLGGRRFQMYVGHNIRKWIEDYFIVVRGLEDSIRKRGGVIEEGRLPSLYHGAYKNIVNYKRRRFHDEMVKVLEDYLKDHHVDGFDLHWYLYANHAPHRNRLGKARYGHGFSAGIWSTKAEADEHYKETGERHQSAEEIMTELQERLSDTEFNHLVKAAGYIYKINQASLRLQLESGLMSLKEAAKNNRAKPGVIPAAYTDDKYQATYVPLQGEGIVYHDIFFEEKLGPGKLGISGVESKRFTGRSSAAENTWAHSIMNMDYQIDRVEKNKVVRSFAELIMRNKDNLKDYATIKEVDPHKGSWDHQDAFGNLNLGLHEKQQTDPDHNIHYKTNGVEWVILVKDKRIGQAFNRTNMSDSGVFMQWASQVNRYFSAIHTSINPEFVLTNFIRDFQTAMINLQGVKETTGEFKDTEALTRKVFKDIKNAGVGLKLFIKDKREDTEWSALAKEFSEEGGRIDFFAFRDAAEFEKKLNNYIKDTTAAGARRWKNTMLEFVGEYNAVFENTMRLSTYKNARDEFIANGMDESDAKRRAADISRNLTVNFSQKGEKGVALNSLYLFFNASVQGTVRMFQAMFRKPKGHKGFTRVQKIMGSVMLFGFAQGILNTIMGGDDEDGVNRYRQIDLRARGRQAHIYLPGFDTFFKIPLPYGYNIPYVMGDTLAALMMGHTNPGRATMHLMSSAAESFVPFSFGGSDDLFVASLQTLSPTITDPFVDLAVNENYFGQPIYKDPVWGSSDPPSERYWGSTGEVTKGVSRALNALTGGNKVEAGWLSVPPDIWEYAWETLGGGAGRFVERSTDLVWSIGPGRLTHRETGDIKWTKVPFARRFMFDETATGNRFIYDQYDSYESAIKQATGLNDGLIEVYGRGKEYNNFKESDDYKLFQLDDFRKDIVADITKLQKKRNLILSNRILRKDVKEDRTNLLEDQMSDLRVKLIKRVDAILK